ncbi:MAG: cbb3-type cytochrome c oxidase N-terminal domain-containing protein [Kofleriaceae bacterium]
MSEQSPSAEAAAAQPPFSDEEYDGIKELDNPQPTWFQLIFAATAVFALGYWIWYHFAGGTSELESYRQDYAAYQAQRAALELAEGAAVSEEALALLTRDAAALTHGKAVFLQSCASCHTENGRGLVGPNLTDDFQLHGATRSDLYNTVRNGVPDKGMIAWGPVLAPGDLTAVVAYIATLRHTNVPGGKPPQGEKVAPFAN